jgi:hypothetical protein
MKGSDIAQEKMDAQSGTVMFLGIFRLQWKNNQTRPFHSFPVGCGCSR